MISIYFQHISARHSIHQDWLRIDAKVIPVTANSPAAQVLALPYDCLNTIYVNFHTQLRDAVPLQLVTMGLKYMRAQNG